LDETGNDDWFWRRGAIGTAPFRVNGRLEDGTLMQQSRRASLLIEDIYGTVGDGGAVVTDDADLAERVRLLRSHGEKPRYHHQMVGTTARLDALQAALLRVKLRHLDDRNDDRRRIGAALRAGLASTSVDLPSPAFEGADHVYHLFIVRTAEREAFRAHLESLGISTAVHYPFPIHRTEAYAPAGVETPDLPAAARLAEEICTLPLFPTMSDEEIDQWRGGSGRRMRIGRPSGTSRAWRWPMPGCAGTPRLSAWQWPHVPLPADVRMRTTTSQRRTIAESQTIYLASPAWVEPGTAGSRQP
jgi:hypothetical protein